MLYAYAIADSVPDPLGAGLHGSSLRAFEEGGLVAIASSHGRAPEAGVEELWRHEQVVERLMGEATVLPLRFGATVADEAELRAMLVGRAGEFGALLERVRGAVELSVRVVPLPPAESRSSAGGDPGEQPSGTEFMRRRGEELRERELAQERFHDPLDACARRSLFSPSNSGGFKAAYLVERDRVGAFSELVGRLANGDGIRISCTGPWPPYSFVSEVTE